MKTTMMLLGFVTALNACAASTDPAPPTPSPMGDGGGAATSTDDAAPRVLMADVLASVTALTCQQIKKCFPDTFAKEYTSLSQCAMKLAEAPTKQYGVRATCPKAQSEACVQDLTEQSTCPPSLTEWKVPSCDALECR